MLLIGEERFAFSEATKPLAEDIILGCLPFVKHIEWTNQQESKNWLDVEHGIDCIARCRQGQPLTIQVKCLSQDYHTITIEGKGVDYAGNPKDGDWSSCLAQFDLIIYSLDGSSISRYALIDNARLTMASHLNRIAWKKRQNKFGHSCFRYIHLAELMELAPDCILSYGGDWLDDFLDKAELPDKRNDI